MGESKFIHRQKEESMACSKVSIFLLLLTGEGTHGIQKIRGHPNGDA